MKAAKPLGYQYFCKFWGYWMVKVKGHPLFPGKTWVKRSRYVMACHLGRRLRKGEVVHHKDHNHANDRISNLAVMSSSAHTTMHHQGVKESETSRYKEAARRRVKDPRYLRKLSARVKKQHRQKNFGHHTWKAT